MEAPPSSLSSPSISLPSNHHPHSFSSKLQIQSTNLPIRAPSVASHISAASGQDSTTGSHFSNGSAPGEDFSPLFDRPSGYGDPMSILQHTPQPHSGGPFAHSNPSAMLPQVTASPPPHAPPYVPPPQHAMAPDPIHSTSMSMMMGQPGPGGMVDPPPGMAWQNGSSQWRPGPNTYPGQPSYSRQNLSNGHALGAQHQLPPNPLDAYGSSRPTVPMGAATDWMSAPTAAMLQQAIFVTNGPGKSGSAHVDGRERRRERSHKDEERVDGERESGKDEPEIITTIFVVGFPDDMGVSFSFSALGGWLLLTLRRNASFRTSSPSPPVSKQPPLNSLLAQSAASPLPHFSPSSLNSLLARTSLQGSSERCLPRVSKKH